MVPLQNITKNGKIKELRAAFWMGLTKKASYWCMIAGSSGENGLPKNGLVYVKRYGKRLIIGYLFPDWSVPVLWKLKQEVRHFEFVNSSTSSSLNALGGTAPAWQSKDANQCFESRIAQRWCAYPVFISTPVYFADIRTVMWTMYTRWKMGIPFCKVVSKLWIPVSVSRTDIYGNTSGTVQAKETDIYLAPRHIIAKGWTSCTDTLFIRGSRWCKFFRFGSMPVRGTTIPTKNWH